MSIGVVTAGAIAGLVQRIRTFFEQRRQLREGSMLYAMSDHMLKDCGIGRSEIDWVAIQGRRSGLPFERNL